MSHVDEGRLHAFLDGALSAADPADAERVELHLAACADCRARLEESARLRDEASALLHGAQPRAYVMPSFDAIRARSATVAPAQRVKPSIFRTPFNDFAWAAMVMLAIGLGWMLNETIDDGDRGVALSDMAGSEAARAPADFTTIDIPLIAPANSDETAAAVEEREETGVETMPAPANQARDFGGAAATAGAGAAAADYDVVDDVSPPAVVTRREAPRSSALALEERASEPVSRDQVASRAVVTGVPAAPPPAAAPGAAPVAAADALAGAASEAAAPGEADWRSITVAEAERLTQGKLVRITGARITASAARGAGEELEVRTVQLTDRGESIKVVQRRTPALELRAQDLDAQAEAPATGRVIAGLTVRVEQWTVTISGAVAPGRLRELAANLT